MRRECGFTLIELIITILFFVIVMAPLATMLSSTMSGGVDDRDSFVAASIARGLLDEIQSMDFEDETANPFGNEETLSVCDRNLFDDVDDYDAYQLWGGCTPARQKNGNPITGTDNFTETVLVQNIQDIEDFAPVGYVRDDFQAVTDGSTNSKQVIVTITWPKGSYQLTTIIMRANE